MLTRTLIQVAAAAAAVVAAVGPLGAQLPAAEGGDVCYRFAFGAWSPSLDRVAAGHDSTARGGPGAPMGRDWAVSGFGGSTLVLFPAWWPAGVSVKLPGPPPAPGDTVRGSATALVADGRVRAPEASIVVLGVPCAAPPSSSP